MNKKLSLPKTILCFVMFVAIFFAYQATKNLIQSVFYSLCSDNYSFGIEIASTVCSSLCSICVCFGLTVLWIKAGLKEDLSSFRIGKGRISLVPALLSLAMPLAVLVLFTLFTDGTWIYNRPSVHGLVYIITYGFFIPALLAGICEETLCRGLLLSAIELRWNRILAVIITSLIFGASHIINGSMTFISFVQLLAGAGLIGAVLAIVCINEGSIWNNVLIHAMWNLAASLFVIYPDNSVECVNGFYPENGLFVYSYRSCNPFVTGWDFGFEVSIFSILVYCAAIVILLLYYKKRGNKAEDTSVKEPF